MEIKIDLPFVKIQESNYGILVTKINKAVTLANEIVRLSELICNKGNKAELSDYNLVIPESNQSCYMKFNILNISDQLIELDLWKLTRSKISLIKSNIIDPIENKENANRHWQKNIGLPYQKIKEFSVLVKSLNRILCDNEVFKDNDDGLGEIDSNILNKLPKFEYKTCTGHKLSALRIRKLDTENHLVRFIDDGHKPGSQSTFTVKISPEMFIDIYDDTKHDYLYNITINAKCKITGRLDDCELVAYEIADISDNVRKDRDMYGPFKGQNTLNLED